MKYIEISITDFKVKQKDQNFFLIDVREEYEYEDFNIGGINIPMQEILSRTAEFDNQTKIILFCSSGKRSKTVAYHLSKTLENTTFYTLRGGLKEYFSN